MIDAKLDLSRSPIAIPERFRDVRYNADHFPGAPDSNGVEGGANCQQYAFSLLRHYGFEIPNLRSSEVWSDTEHTRVSEHLTPFDLVLVHNKPESFGAHIGLGIGDGLILHLSRKIDAPAIETITEMQARDEYRYLIGFKTVLVHNNKKGDAA